MKVALTSVSVHNPIEAFKFYTEKLGFLKKVYIEHGWSRSSYRLRTLMGLRCCSNRPAAMAVANWRNL